ncbi:MAG TPA: hypothetical protein VGR93_11250, partial [Candidatus Acidoferrales bacterium]|nr:hypothetical protein [Candidatus Acidoferrales bacterium]
RSTELQSQVADIQSRLSEYIEATRPAHEANLRGIPTDPFSNSLPHPTEPNSPQAPSPQQPKSRRTRRRRKAPQIAPAFPYERHRRKCQICRHRHRELIEADFVEWRDPGDITSTYKITYDALYRHANATGLSAIRRENVSIVVQKVLENVEYVQEPSAAAILRAVRTLASLDSRGRWAEPTTTHVVVNTTAAPAQSANPTTSSDAPALVNSSLVSSGVEPQALSVQNSNRKIYEKLEPEVSHT